MMPNLQEFLDELSAEYKTSARSIRLFNPADPIQWNNQRKKFFVRMFYHSRGHFDRFLWLMASLAPPGSPAYRPIVLKNITDELGGLNPGDLSHEQLFYQFAEKLDPEIRDEPKDEGFYLPFLRQFNDGHIKALLNADWDTKWAIFSAYELLDNTDYNNLFWLAETLGLSEEALVFFDVHRNGDHFSETFQLLEAIWTNDSHKVRTAFDFIGKHQLAMWRKMSELLMEA